MPQPITTARAWAGKLIRGVSFRWSPSSQDFSDRALEAGDVAPHDVLSGVRVTGADGREQLAVLAHGGVETGHAIEGQEPDAQCEHVILVQRLLEKRVVGAAVDVPVDALVELDQRALVALPGCAADLLEQLFA